MTASTSNPNDGPVAVEELEDGQIWRVRLATPKANILDIEKTERLSALFGRATEQRGLKAILIEGEGPHFSFGASVPEHLPGQFERMLRGFHGLFYRMLDAEVMTLAHRREGHDFGIEHSMPKS
jgi:cyclohexa-1,5-dienecarbonyl-CoA hydratase